MLDRQRKSAASKRLQRARAAIELSLGEDEQAAAVGHKAVHLVGHAPLRVLIDAKIALRAAAKVHGEVADVAANGAKQRLGEKRELDEAAHARAQPRGQQRGDEQRVELGVVVGKDVRRAALLAHLLPGVAQLRQAAHADPRAGHDHEPPEQRGRHGDADGLAAAAIAERRREVHQLGDEPYGEQAVEEGQRKREAQQQAERAHGEGEKRGKARRAEGGGGGGLGGDGNVYYNNNEGGGGGRRKNTETKTSLRVDGDQKARQQAALELRQLEAHPAQPRQRARQPQPAHGAVLEVGDGAAVADVARGRGRRAPRPLERLLPGGAPHARPQRVVAQQLLHALGALLLAARREQEAVARVGDDVRDAARVRAHHRHARRHALQHDEAQRLRLGRHDKHVGGRERAAELLAVQNAREDGVGAGQLALQRALVRAVAHQRQAAVREARQQRLEEDEVLLGADAPHVDEQRLARVAGREALAHALALEARVEDGGVDALAPQPHALEAVAHQLLAQLRRRGEREVGAVVLQAQHGPDDGLQRAEPVVLGVDGQVRVVAEQQRLAQQAREQQRGEDEEAGRGEVDDVRVKVAQRGVHAAQAERERDAAVEREAEAGHVDDARAGKLGGRVAVVVGHDDQHVVAGAAQLHDEVLEAVGVAGGVREGGGLDEQRDAAGGGGVELQVCAGGDGVRVARGGGGDGLLGRGAGVGAREHAGGAPHGGVGAEGGGRGRGSARRGERGGGEGRRRGGGGSSSGSGAQTKAAMRGVWRGGARGVWLGREGEAGGAGRRGGGAGGGGEGRGRGRGGEYGGRGGAVGHTCAASIAAARAGRILRRRVGGGVEEQVGGAARHGGRRHAAHARVVAQQPAAGGVAHVARVVAAGQLAAHVRDDGGQRVAAARQRQRLAERQRARHLLQRARGAVVREALEVQHQHGRRRRQRHLPPHAAAHLRRREVRRHRLLHGAHRRAVDVHAQRPERLARHRRLLPHAPHLAAQRAAEHLRQRRALPPAAADVHRPPAARHLLPPLLLRRRAPVRAAPLAQRHLLLVQRVEHER
ncbi:hypothetical protein FGB62_2g134 [Gracilaria domingensis]|nr:hypothetical protein FGB62_2g134 [Gracilaria domingensis]